MLMKNLYLNTGTTSSATSKRLCSSKLSDLIKLFLPFKLGSLNKWDRDSSFLQLLIWENVIKIQAFKLHSSLFCQLVQILLLISFVLLNNQVWVRELSQFLWVKVKVKKHQIWLMIILKKEDGFYYKIVTWLSVGCLNSKS